MAPEPRWVVIVLPLDYNKSHYEDLYSLIVNPIIKKYNGSNHKCVYDGFTESEHKFEDITKATACVKELNTIFKLVSNEMRLLFESESKNNKKKSNFKIGPVASVEPVYYEKNGNRGIVRLGSETIKNYKPKKCKGFEKTMKVSKNKMNLLHNKYITTDKTKKKIKDLKLHNINK